MTEGNCRSCGALVLWVTMHPSGKTTPLDAVPKAGGNVERKKGLTSEVWYGRVIPAEERGERKLYYSHFATCPQAGGWRQRKTP